MSSSTSSSKVTGLVSGFDTQSIVESFMAMEKVPMTKLEVKKQTEDLKLQAYQAVNTYVLKFKEKMNTLASKKLWNSKAATSTNDKILNATANEYAVNGAYSFKVAQLATATQYMSQGFASKNDPLAKQGTDADGNALPPEKLGTINLSSGKARVDNSAELEALNGGKGVYRGSIRVTDASNTTSVIDLSSCVTMDDVVRSINESTGAQIEASLKEGRLVINDASNGSGTMKITNVGTGTTATDLGIVGSVSTRDADGKLALEGRNVYIMGNATALKDLNDGLGTEEGKFKLKVQSAEGSYYDIIIDTTDCRTVADLTKKVNDTIADAANNGGGDLDPKEFEGLRFSVSEDGTSFGLSGTKAGMSYEFYDYDSGTVGKANPAKNLGIADQKLTATKDGETISYKRVFGGINSPMLKNLSGANGTGVGIDPEDSDNWVVAPFGKNTLVSTLNEGKGLDLSSTLQVVVYEGGKKVNANGEPLNHVAISDIVTAADMKTYMKNNPTATVENLIGFLNAKLEDYAADPTKKGAAAISGMRLGWDDATGTIGFTGVQAGYEYEIYGTMANGLGLSRSWSLDDSVKPSLGTSAARGSAQNDAVHNFMNGASLISGNDFLDSTGGTATMANLVGLAGISRDVEVPPGSGTYPFRTGDNGDGTYSYDEDAWKAACIDALQNGTTTYGGRSLKGALGASFDMTYSVGSNNWGITVDWNDVYDKLGNPADLTSVSVDDFLNATNDVIAAEFKTLSQSSGAVLHPPKLSLNENGTGFGWSNIDYSKDITISGFDSAFDLNRTTVGKAEFDMMSDSFTMKPDNLPMIPGYSRWETITNDNASQHKISELNFGFGLQLASYKDKSLAIALGDINDPDNILTIDVADIIAGLGGESALGDATVEDYLGVLNNLTSAALTSMNATKGLTGDDRIDFKWAVSEGDGGGMAMTGIKNVDKVTFGGDAAWELVTGIDGYQVYDDGTPSVAWEYTVPASGELRVGEFSAATFHTDVDSGVGAIEMSLGNGASVKLSTDGLSQDSTLADLLDKLNSELDALADGTHKDAGKYTAEERAAFKDIRFSLNDSGTGIAVDNTSNKSVTFHDSKDSGGGSDNNTLAQDLGLIKSEKETGTVDAYSFSNAGSVGKRYIGRGTDLEDWIGTGAEKGALRVTDAVGRSRTIDMGECKTIGDVIDAINIGYAAGEIGIYAELNDTGDGINITERYRPGYEPDKLDQERQITIADEFSGVIAKKLNIAGTAKVTKDDEAGSMCTMESKMSKSIDVMSTDTLESIMYRISEAGYKSAIINDGTGATPFRLSVSATTTGKANDFVIESDIEMFGFNQTQRGRDSKVLYGDPNSTSSPVMLSSSTNSNSSAILGLTLDLKQVSNEWTTITVDTDKDKVTEEIKGMVEAYNELSGIISMLDGYDDETGEKGILFNDNSVKSMMDAIDEYFYMIFDPNNLGLGGKDDSGKQATWTWQDLGVTLTAANSNADGTGNWYSLIDLDTDKLEDMVASNWDMLSTMLAGERNIANSNLADNIKPSASFNGAMVKGYDQVNTAINGDSSKGQWGTGNGIMAADTIASGANTYTVQFQKATTVTRMNIIHFSNDTSLKDFDIEYMDPKTGEWQLLRSINGNVTDANYLSVTPPREVSGLRIVASSSNAKDDTFRLVDFQVFEETGLAGKLNQYANQLGDTHEGFMATQNTTVKNNIKDIEEQMDRLQNRLDAKEESLWRKFNAMEVALGKLQNQGNYFNSMMGNNNNSSSSKK